MSIYAKKLNYKKWHHFRGNNDTCKKLHVPFKLKRSAKLDINFRTLFPINYEINVFPPNQLKSAEMIDRAIIAISGILFWPTRGRSRGPRPTRGPAQWVLRNAPKMRILAAEEFRKSFSQVNKLFVLVREKGARRIIEANRRSSVDPRQPWYISPTRVSRTVFPSSAWRAPTWRASRTPTLRHHYAVITRWKAILRAPFDTSFT